MHETETERKKESNVCVRREESLLGRPELDEPRLNRNIKIIIHPGSVWVESDVVFRLQYRWPNGVLDCNLLTKLSQKNIGRMQHAALELWECFGQCACVTSPQSSLQNHI